MDIHRCRFVNYSPSTINVVAFSHSHSSQEKKINHLRLAIGRANGDIEIWNPLRGAWVQETVLRGGKGRSVDGLVWIQDPEEKYVAGQPIPGRLRLFSTGYTTTITEWDLEKGQPLRQASGNHGEIWCLAAQPAVSQLKNESNNASITASQLGQNLVTGCTDGAVVLYSTECDGLRLDKIIARPSVKKAKVISITFRDRNIFVTGCTDSTIRIYDIAGRTMVKSMSLGTGPVGGPKDIIVWAVKCLPNGNIVSGDSTGELRIWDGKTFTLIQRILSHRQDILSLGTSMDGSTILSGGMDRRTVIYKQIGESKSRWGEVSHRRFHTHDVKTMTTFEGNGMSVIVSGGPDASPIVIPLREFGRENHRILPCLPQMPIVQSASKKRLLLSWWDREVHIWKIHETLKPQHEEPNPDSESEHSNRSRRLIAKVMIKGETNITSASITTEGNLLAVSTSAEIKIFRLKPLAFTNEEGLRISKLDICIKLSNGGGRLLQFSPDGKWLCIVRRDSQVSLARIHRFGNNSVRILPVIADLDRLDRKIEKRGLLGGLGAYERMVSRVAFSSDSRILAASDLAGYIDTWVLEGQEDLSETADHDMTGNDTSLPSPFDHSDSGDEEVKTYATIYGQHWIRNPMAASIPKLPAMALVLSFRPPPSTANKSPPRIAPNSGKRDLGPHLTDLLECEDRLIVVNAGGAVLEFAVLKGELSAWSRRNPTANFPNEFKKLLDQAMGCVWDFEDSRERLWLYGTNWMWMFDLSRDLPCNSTSPYRLTKANGHEVHRQHPQRFRKRKRDDKQEFESGKLKSGTSGAGGIIPDNRLNAGISRTHEEIRYERRIMKQRILDHRQRRPSMDMDESEEQVGRNEEGVPLERLRQLDDPALPNGNGRTLSIKQGGGEVGGSFPYWYTYKYRPIMGIVPIDGEVGLEVVLVERPAWEMDLPPRYYGNQEWDMERMQI